MAVSGLVAALSAGTALWLPRGPISTAEALSVMALSSVVGAGAGYLLRSRWALLLAPVTYAVVFEGLRLGTDGPLVDRVVLGSPYGVIAFVLGRGLHGVLALAPLMLGAALGAGYARREQQRGRTTAATVLGRSGAVVVALALLALAAAVARPASTAAILTANGADLEGSVAELTQVQAGGHDLGLMLRGNSTDSPVLLYLAGGPGGSERGAMRRHAQALERDFVVATLDQRGAGTSYGELDPVDSLTLDNAVQDVITVTRYLRERFHEDRIVLVGQSWGTIPAVLAVQGHPELFRAYVGVGQMVDPLETDTVFYEDTLGWARSAGERDLADTLVASGPPPYDDVLDYEAALSHEPDVYPYDHTGNAEGVGGFSENLLVREYSLLQQAQALAAFMDVFTVVYPQLQALDLRRDVPALAVPVYLAQGRHEAPGRSEPAREWFDALDAPLKELTQFERSGHRPLFEQPAEFRLLMLDVLEQS